MTDLANQTALVTGASRGIGRAAAAKLADAGARVIVHYSASRDAAEALVAEIRAKGGEADAVPADLAAGDGPFKLAEAVKALGITKLDILVANAGVATFAGIEEQTVEDFDRQFAVNVRAPFFTVQQLLPLMGEGTRIVLLSSVVARAAFPGAPAYSATKGAVDVLVRSFAIELGPKGIRVNAVAPGATETDMASFLQNPAAREGVLAGQALKRIAQPDDIADVILFLSSDAGRWITGRTIEASGGSRL
ncbi:SDR family NAD(P)-dependent oxidoreductase [Sphingomonas sp. MMS24-J13]|uniref:SDR family NAD(P)-dependent oxidoreductase n=1 Tax=Sphingomonas sp. MMS24-J13 TaxID=3238686 RepID=UPI00384D1C2A